MRAGHSWADQRVWFYNEAEELISLPRPWTSLWPVASPSAYHLFDPADLPIENDRLPHPRTFAKEATSPFPSIWTGLSGSPAAQPSKRPRRISNGEPVLSARAGLAD